MSRALIGFGANLGEPAATFDTALAMLTSDGSCQLLARSHNYRSAPIGGPANQPVYINAAALIDTNLSPRHLLERLQRIEAHHGRRRGERWGPRTLDLDILLIDDRTIVVHDPQLIIPHPRLTFRRFVLEPAAEIAPQMIHPELRWTLAELLANVKRSNRYVAVSGPRSKATRHMLAQVIDRTDVELIESPDDYPTTNGGGSLWRDVPRPAEGASAAAPTGPTEVRALECLQRCLTLLDASCWTSPERVAICDFWLLELYAWGATTKSLEELVGYVDDFSQLANQKPMPTLLVMRSWLTMPANDEAETPSDELPPLLKIVSQQDSPLFQPSQLSSSFRGFAPVLWLNDPKVESQVDEISAAVMAIQDEVTRLS